MKKRIRTASAILLAVCSAATVLTACGEKNVTDLTATHSSSSLSAESTESAVVTAASDTAVKATEAVTREDANNTSAPVTDKATEKTATTQKTASTTLKAPSTEVIPEKSKGISLMTKTTPVITGNSAVIMIQGTPGKKYSIDFYESSGKTADYDGLESKTADSNGFVTWTFTVDDSCDRGNRKIVVKEKNSSNYLQTSIVVQ